MNSSDIQLKNLKFVFCFIVQVWNVIPVYVVAVVIDVFVSQVKFMVFFFIWKELEIQQIMDNFNCEYDNVVEAVDLYNLDIEECTTA